MSLIENSWMIEYFNQHPLVSLLIELSPLNHDPCHPELSWYRTMLARVRSKMTNVTSTAMRPTTDRAITWNTPWSSGTRYFDSIPTWKYEEVRTCKCFEERELDSELSGSLKSVSRTMTKYVKLNIFYIFQGLRYKSPPLFMRGWNK